MTQKPVDLDAFYISRSELASADLTKSNIEAMDKVLEEVTKQRQARIKANQANQAKPVDKPSDGKKTK